MKKRQKKKRARTAKESPLIFVVAGRFAGTVELARKVGCSSIHLSGILHGRRKASAILRQALASYGVTKTAEGIAL